jgi:hypothetical protein
VAGAYGETRLAERLGVVDTWRQESRGGCRWERWGPCAKYCEIRPDKGRKTSIWLTFRANMAENNEIVQSKISLQPKYDSVLNAAGRAAISKGFGVPPTGRGRRKFAVVLTRGRPARAALRFIQTTGVMLPPKKAGVLCVQLQ